MGITVGVAASGSAIGGDARHGAGRGARAALLIGASVSMFGPRGAPGWARDEASASKQEEVCHVEVAELPTRGDADIAAVASLLADQARCKVLLALDDGRALPASVLADEAGVAGRRQAATGGS